MKRARHAVLLGSLCAALGLVHGLRVSDRLPVLPLSQGWQALAVEWQMRFDETGPLFRNAIHRKEQLELREVLLPDSVAIPLRSIDTALHKADGTIVGIRILDTDIGIADLLASTIGHSFTTTSCDQDMILLTPALRRRLSLASGDSVHVGSEYALVGPDLPRGLLSALPDSGGVEAMRCGPTNRAALDQIDGFLLLYPDAVATSQLQARLAGLARTETAFDFRWQTTSPDASAAKAASRRVGWLLGLEILLGFLAVGAMVLSAVMTVMVKAGDEWVRSALGEAERHRFRRIVAGGVGDAIIAVTIAVAIAGALSQAANAWRLLSATIEGLHLAATIGAGLFAVGLSVFDTLLRGVIGRWLARKPIAASGFRVSGRKRSIAVATALAAVLCAGVCVPATFLMVEFVRLGQQPQGYNTHGLYSSRLILLNHDQRTQQQWWQALDALRQEASQVTGATGVGFISPSPWDYAGWPSVLDAEHDMILNVGVSEGVIALLAPAAWIGVDITDSVDGLQVIVQNMDETRRRQFLPTGATVVGELHGLRFSPLDEVGRSAVLRSLRSGIGPTVHLIFRANDGQAPVEAIQALLSRPGASFAAGPVRQVDEVLSDRMSPVRTSALIATAIAAIAIVLLGIVLLASVRLYLIAHRRDLSIQLCLGATPARLAGMLSLHCAAVTAAGWAIGTGVGLVIWQQIVAVMHDHRLTQPWPSYWLLLVALLIVTPYYLYLTARQVRRLDLSAALQA